VEWARKVLFRLNYKGPSLTRSHRQGQSGGQDPQDQVEGSGVPPFPHLPAHGAGEARHFALLHGRGLVPGQRQGGGLR